MALIAWLVPAFIEGSGGHRTIFQNVSALVKAGHECHVYVERWGKVKTPNTVSRIAREWFGECGAQFHVGFEVIKPCDLLFATVWYSAKYARNSTSARLKAYFIQDLESYFNPMGDGFLLAENSYRYGLHPFTIGSWLAHEMINTYKAEGCSFFDFCADLSIYHPLPDSKPENAVCYVYQPEKPRRCAIIGLQALGILKTIRPEVKIYLYGSKDICHEISYDFEYLGLLSLEQCNSLYNQCTVGLCISSSNPSRIPFEMMAAGLPVVDLFRQNNLFDLPDSATLLSCSQPENIAQALCNIIDDPKLYEKMHVHGIEYMKNRSIERGFDQFVTSVNYLLKHETLLAPKIPDRYNAPPVKVGGEISSRIWNDLVWPKQPSPIQATRRAIPLLRQFISTWMSSCINRVRIYRNKNISIQQAAIKKNSPYIISLDVWDTILFRKCHHEETKIHSAKILWLYYHSFLLDDYMTIKELFYARKRAEQILSLESQQRGEDGEYKLMDVLQVWLSLVTYMEKDTITQASHRILRSEVKFEKYISYPNEHIWEFIGNVESADELIYISDSYLSGNLMRELLEHHGIHTKFNRGYISCDHMLNKQTGKLFELAIQEIGGDHHQFYHIGDSFEADVRVPSNLGIKTKHYVHDRKRINGLEKMFSKRFNGVQTYIKTLEDTIGLADYPPKLTKEQATYYSLGNRYALIFLPFVMCGIERGIQGGHDTLWYFTREGKFFASIHRAMSSTNYLSGDIPEAKILEVSRIATFGPSLRELSVKELMRLWTLYSTQSISALLRTLDVYSAEISTVLDQHGIDSSLPIKYPWKDERIIRLFGDPSFNYLLNKSIKNNRKNLYGYLESRGFLKNNRNIIVDIGWRGSIQDNLCYMLPWMHIDGTYLGLQPFLNDQPVNSGKHAFGPDANVEGFPAERLLLQVPFFEMLCNSDGGTTTGYKMLNGRTSAVRLNNSEEDAVFYQFSQYFQQGVLDVVPKVCQIIEEKALTSTELRANSLRLMERIAFKPEVDIAKFFFRLNHNETFGTGDFERPLVTFPYGDFIKGFFGKKHRDAFIEKIQSSRWTQGLLTVTGHGILRDIYNRRVLHYPKQPSPWAE